MKKLTSILLALAMILTLAPMSVFAEDAEKAGFSDVNEGDYYAHAAVALEKLEILAGYPDGTFGADKAITRAEMAAVVCRMIDKEADSQLAKGATSFDDVPENNWASGYINVATAEGIIAGDGNGKFRPGDDVKYEEAIKMIVCAMGYDDKVVFDESDWSKGYLEVAEAKGITADLKGTKGTASTRGDVAVMSYNGLASIGANSKIPATPVPSLAGGEFTSYQKITLKTDTAYAEIYYTTDGTTPTEKSNRYTKEITISKTTTIKAVAIKGGIVSKDVMTAEYVIKKSSGGGGGGGGGGGSTSYNITAANFSVSGANVTTANVGDTITFGYTPAYATGTITWTIGGVPATVNGNSYTITSLDMGKTIKAEIVATGIYRGSASAEITVANQVQVNASDIMSGNADTAPVVLTDAQNTTFLDDEGNEVTVDESSVLTLSINNSEVTDQEVSDATTLAVQSFIQNSGVSVSETDLADVTAVAVDVDLTLDETKVHPVGDVSVTLSAEQLGLPAGADLEVYSFSANHTNKNGENEVVPGEVVEIDGVKYVRFDLNGLSTIWIGNIPPRTVGFYNTQEDADNKVNCIGEVIVKFGDLTPTRQIPTPSRSGYLFVGWNYDMTRTPIISNLEVHALWTEGVKMPAENISAELTPNTDAFEVDIAEGSVSVDTVEDKITPANVDVMVGVTPMDGAVAYYAGTDAAVVAAYNDAEGFTPVPASKIYFNVDVTDESGIVIPTANKFYYKWIDANGNALAIEEVKVTIANGTATATSMEYTSTVDRGIGKVEAYLVDNNDANKTYVAYINNNISGNAIDGYTLNNNASFDGYRVDYDFSPYDVIRLEFTPFDGETFKATDVISATGEYYNGDTWVENWNGTYQIVDGKLIVTYPFAVVRQVVDYADVFVEVNGKRQDIYLDWYGSGSAGIQNETIDCNTWAEVVAALRTVTTNKSYQINCADTSEVTITGNLFIPANVRITLSKCPKVTVASGATLTMQDSRTLDSAAQLYIRRGDFVVENGAAVTETFVGTTNGSRYYPSIRGCNVTFKSGSTLSVPDDGLISFYGQNYDQEEYGVLTFEAGSVVNVAGNFNTHNFKTINLNGTFNSTYYSYFYSDEINVNGALNINYAKYGRCELYGTVTVGENASIVYNNTNTRSSNIGLEIYGPFVNKGNLEIKGTNSTAEIMNNGFVNYNEGAISVGASCKIRTSGTKFVNTGVISGAGTLEASLGDDYTNYQDGTDYVEVEDDEYWDEDSGEYVYKLVDYSRYKYVCDPAETVDTILYLAEVVNMGNGQCTLTINAEAFPQN